MAKKWMKVGNKRKLRLKKAELPFRAWACSNVCGCLEITVVARTKQRAREICGQADPCFDERWLHVHGKKSHDLRCEEGIWGQNKGIYVRCLTSEESISILDAHLEKFMSMEFEVLSSLVGGSGLFEETSEQGISYKLHASVSEPSDRPGCVKVTIVLNDGLNHPCGYACEDLRVPIEADAHDDMDAELAEDALTTQHSQPCQHGDVTHTSANSSANASPSQVS